MMKLEVLAKNKDSIEVLGRLVLASLAFCYVIGLLVVNVYYSRFGVYSLSLFRLNYVIAGLWVIAPIVFVALLAGAVANLIHFFQEYGNGRVTIKASTFMTSTLFAVVVVGGEIIVLVAIRNRVPNWGELLVAPGILVGLLYGAYLARKNNWWFMGVFTTIVLMGVSYIVLFAQSTYGNIPAFLGGGAPKPVQLLLKVDEKEKMYFTRSGLHFYKDLDQTETARLLFETDNEYILIVNSNMPGSVNTLSIKRDLVESVLYEGFLEPPTYGGGDSFDEPTPAPSVLVTPAQTSSSTPAASPCPSPQASPV